MPPKRATPTPNETQAKTAEDSRGKKKKPANIDLSTRPETSYNVLVFGSNDDGQLGMAGLFGLKSPGPSPKLNRELTSREIVQVACGATHGVALTSDGAVYTWGCNNLGELGRDSTSHGEVYGHEDGDFQTRLNKAEQKRGLKPGELGMWAPAERDQNYTEETPMRVFGLRGGITQVMASESASFALTKDGRVWGWGTFKSNEGSLGLTPETAPFPQYRPIVLTSLSHLKIVALASSPRANHLLMLTANGTVHTIGTGEQNQLGRKLVERNKSNGLKVGTVSFIDPNLSSTPRKRPRIEITSIATGNETSYAVDAEGRVWSWGQDDFAQLGHDLGDADYDAAERKPNDVSLLNPERTVDASYTPAPVHALELSTAGPIKRVTAGRDFALALTREGKIYAWGRLDGLALGLNVMKLPNSAVRFLDSSRSPATVVVAQPVDLGGTIAVDLCAGPGHALVVTSAGELLVWGAGSGFRLGLGAGTDGWHNDQPLPTLCTRARGMIARAAVAGKEFGVILAEKTVGEDGFEDSGSEGEYL